MYERILVPVDDGQPAREAARQARTLARWTGASVHLLHVVEVDNPMSFGIDEVAALNDAEAFLDGLMSELFDGDDDVHSAVRRGTPSEEIVAFAHEEGVDLVVMGRHGTGDLRDYLLGSTPVRVLQLTTVPTLLVSDDRDRGTP